jgi:hypothetical protein
VQLVLLPIVWQFVLYVWGECDLRRYHWRGFAWRACSLEIVPPTAVVAVLPEQHVRQHTLAVAPLVLASRLSAEVKVRIGV